MFSVNTNLVRAVGWFTFFGINKGNLRRGRDCVWERLNKSNHTLFLFAQTLAICLTLLLLRRDMFAISASVYVHAWVCVHVSVSVCLGGGRSRQTSPTVSPGTILCGLICEGRREPTAPCYSSVLISSAFRLYLDPLRFLSLPLICSHAG